MMKLKETLADTFIIKAMCSQDGCAGEFKDTGHMTLTDPPGYMHLCNVCRNYEQLDKSYPTTEIRPQHDST